MLCDLMGLPRSSYYYVPQIRDDQELRDAIERTCSRYTRYRYRRVTPVLKREQFRVGKERVRLLMGEMGLQVRQRRRKVRTTVSEGEAPYPNLLKGLEIQYPDHVWCGDLSYIGLMDGSMAYLAILLDISPG